MVTLNFQNMRTYVFILADLKSSKILVNMKYVLNLLTKQNLY